MIVELKVVKKFDVKTLLVKAGVRYWEDATVNGENDDEDGSLIPCKNGDNWEPIIDIETGVITNWKAGYYAHIHYKVCDDGYYEVLDADGNIVCAIDGYVPDTMCPSDSGYGDYIMMDIDCNGVIENFDFNIGDFIEDEW